MVISSIFKRFFGPIQRMVEKAKIPFNLEIIVKMPRGPPPLHSNSRLIWIDCEMTGWFLIHSINSVPRLGLEIENHRLVEIACIVTESNLDVSSLEATYFWVLCLYPLFYF